MKDKNMSDKKIDTICVDSKEVPLADNWLTKEEMDAVRKDVRERFGTPKIKWDKNPILNKLLPNAKQVLKNQAVT